MSELNNSLWSYADFVAWVFEKNGVFTTKQ